MTTRACVLVLYVTADCGLCDDAVDMLAEARAPDFTVVSIDGDAELESRYGVRVPVLLATGAVRDLGWPFDAESVRRYLRSATPRDG